MTVDPNRREDREGNSYRRENTQWEKTAPFNKQCWENGHSYGTRSISHLAKEKELKIDQRL